ncbi:hypothetical protein [Rugosimonospora acidiphila]|uniref:hypothetical protein n=1 Tax=Rugosimonospora acidiphila TaxID=556531 RepID=UPI0031EF0917
MIRWRYFINSDKPELADEGKAGLTRLPEGAPVALAEALIRGGWQSDDRMWRAKYLGSDYEFTEITEERAYELIRSWVASGWLERMPDDASTITPELAERLTAMDRKAAAAWRDVPKPPGAEDIDLPGAENISG